MQVIRNRPREAEIDAETHQQRRSVVTIGNFDGVHVGHQALLRRCKALGQSGDAVAVVTFEPLPQAFFRPHAAPARLTTVYQKLTQLNAAGVDLVWMLRFDLELSRLSAQNFARQVLAGRLHSRHVVVGADFQFGFRREGNVTLLRALGEDLGFEVHVEPPVRIGAQRVSSTAIRHVLAEGEFAAAAALLGRPFRLEGHVVMGQQLGRQLGYPTANLRIRGQPSPVQGIFAVFARDCSAGAGQWMPAVCSLGCRPTVGGEEPLLEVHFFDLNRDLYGRRLEVEFVAKLRDETHFDSVEELTVQMRHDENEARNILAQHNKPT